MEIKCVIKAIFLGIGVIVLAINTMTCSSTVTDDYQGERIVSARPIEEVLSEYTDELMAIPGVVGIAQGLSDDKPCIKVFVIEKTLELDQKIPRVLEGYPVVIEETGGIQALPEEK